MALFPLALLLTAVGTVAAVALTHLYGALGRALSASESAPSGAEMKPYILWGMFYVNPNDPRGWVPKINGFGMTPNFRTRFAASMLLRAAVVALVGALGVGVS
jgi:uncharacterized membrane protein